EKTAGSRLSDTVRNRSPKASRLKPRGGETAAAPSSRQNPGVSPPPSSNRLAIRNSGSPRKGPPRLVVNMSLMEGTLVSPAIFQSKLPPKAFPMDSQKSEPDDRANPKKMDP